MNEYKIMVVDNEPDILNLLGKSLNMEGFPAVIKVDTGRKAVNTCKEIQPDIIILDVMLPDIDGYEVCKQIRQFSHCPILFLSSKNDELDKILGLAVGGDDYVTKPFSPKEIAYRVKAQLRRMEYKQNPPGNQTIEIGALTIDTDGCRALKDGRDLELTAREFEILQYLAENKGRVISRERLYEAIWNEDSFGCDNTVMVHIRHLREKMESNPATPQYLITRKGLGCFYHCIRIYTFPPIVLYAIITISARRKIRGYYRAGKCNAPFWLILMRFFRHSPCQFPAVPCDDTVKLFMVGTFFLRIRAQNAYFIQNTYNILLGRH